MAAQSPAREALNRAIAANKANGHENLGALSEEFGFIPATRPLERLPDSHSQWDDLAHQLPSLHLTLGLRQAVEKMATLDASAGHLPDEFLSRAALVLSTIAHAYWWVEPEAPDELPECLSKPWEQVSARLGRPEAFMPYTDVFLYNWRASKDCTASDLKLERLEVLVPTFGNAAERIFLLTQVEIHAHCSAIVGAVVRAQEAVIADDPHKLGSELLSIVDCLNHITNYSLLKIDADPYSPTYVDPVVWSKTIARYAVPIKEGIQGPSGTASPLFQLLDIFVGRNQFNSPLGQAALQSRKWLALNHVQFLDAVEQVSIRDYVRECSDPKIKGLFQSVLEAYVGDTGFLGAHRLKAYGFLETAFKMGRTSEYLDSHTRIKDRGWEYYHAQLAQSRLERLEGAPTHCQFGQIVSSEATTASADDQVKSVIINTKDAGIRFEPGDRVGIFPENSPELISKTLKALKATGAENIRLDGPWKSTWPSISGNHADSLPLADLLRYAKICPVTRDSVQTLFKLTFNSRLQTILHRRNETQWELSGILEMLAKSGFDTRRLWKSEPWEPENICKLAPTSMFKMFTAASAMDGETDDTAQTLEITIGELEEQAGFYPSSTESEEFGEASSSITRSTWYQEEFGMFANGANLTLKVVHPTRFHLPIDAKTPIVMFASGPGIAPFRSFIQARSRMSQSGENWLFFGANNHDEFLYRDEIESYVSNGRLKFEIAFSAENIEAEWDNLSKQYKLVTGSPRFVSQLIESETIAAKIWDCIRTRSEGGLEASFYVSGSAGFAVSIMSALKSVVARFSGANDEMDAEEIGKVTLFRMVGAKRFMQYVYASYTPFDEDERTYQVSEIARHNSDQDGYWTVINGKVYDVTTYLNLHPGGNTILRFNAGLDATTAFESVQHHLNSEINAVLGMYQIGRVQQLDFANSWGVAVGSEGLRFVSLDSAHLSWVQFLYRLVEIENLIAVDLASLYEPLTQHDSGQKLTPLKLQMVMDTHLRFRHNCLDGAFSQDLHELWANSIGLCGPQENIQYMQADLKEIYGNSDADFVHKKTLSLRDEAVHLLSQEAESVERNTGIIQTILNHDLNYLASLKRIVSDCVRVFETYEHATATFGNEELLDTIRQIPAITKGYYESMANDLA